MILNLYVQEVERSIERLFYWAGYADKYGGTVQETQLYGTVLTSSLSFISVGTELGTLLICKLIKTLFDIPLGFGTQSGIEVKGALNRGGLKFKYGKVQLLIQILKIK